MRLRYLLLTLVLLATGCRTSPILEPTAVDTPEAALRNAANGFGKSSKIKVTIDTSGIPHILADTANGAYFAQGFLHAYFRLWQMEYRARLVEGTSGLLTSGTLTRDDQFAQKGDLLAAAIKIESEILKDPEMKGAALAYCEGVNARIRQLNARTMPDQYRKRGLQPRPWSPLHIALSIVSSAWGQARPANELHLDSIKNLISKDEFQRFFPLSGQLTTSETTTPHEKRREYSFFLNQLQSSLSTGSNAFSIHGSRTVTGKPIVANDFHLDYIVPTLLLPMQLVTDQFNAFGSTSIGIPGVISGTNRHIAWSVVNSMADTTDWFRLTFRDPSHQEYKWNGQWRRVDSRFRETALSDGTVTRIEIRMTEAGPLLPIGSNGEELALSWIGAVGKTTFLPFILFPKAERTETCGDSALLASLSHVVLTCADQSNSIGEWWGGLIPNRAKKRDPRTVVEVESSRQIWSGYSSAQTRLRRTNIRDFSVNANSAPDHVSDSLSFYIGWEFSPPFRRNRIVDLLRSHTKLHTSDAIQIQSDITDYRHSELGNLLPLAFEQSTDDGSCEKTLALDLKNWNARYEFGSVLASLYQDLVSAIERRLVPSAIGAFGEQLGSVRMTLFQTLRDGLKTKNREVIAAVRSSAAELCRVGTKRQPWGTTNPAQFHTFGATDGSPYEEIEAPGATSTVFSQGRIRGTVWRMVTQLDKRPRIWFSSIGQLNSETGGLVDTQWTQRWSKQEMVEVRFFEPSDFSSR